MGTNHFYIGLIRSGDSWTWSNGDSSTYTNWQSGKTTFFDISICLGVPTNDNTKNCVIFDSESGSWSNEDCDTIHSYICQLYI